jgi:hypothetical protein
MRSLHASTSLSRTGFSCECKGVMHVWRRHSMIFFGDALERNDFYEEITVNARGLNRRSIDVQDVP